MTRKWNVRLLDVTSFSKRHNTHFHIKWLNQFSLLCTLFPYYILMLLHYFLINLTLNNCFLIKHYLIAMQLRISEKNPWYDVEKTIRVRFQTYMKVKSRSTGKKTGNDLLIGVLEVNWRYIYEIYACLLSRCEKECSPRLAFQVKG